MQQPRDSNDQHIGDELSWESYISDIPAFLETLDKRSVTSAGVVLKDTVLPLLKEVLEGLGSLHWIGFGLKLLAWAMDRSDQHHNNYKQCRELLENTLFLLKDTLNMWEAYGNSSSTDVDLMHFNLPRIAEASLRASVISACFCSSTTDNINRRFYAPRYMKNLRNWLGAADLGESIREVKKLIQTLQGQNQSAATQAQINNTSIIRLTSYHTIDAPLGRSNEAREVERILIEYNRQEIVAVCLHGMGGVGKTTLADQIFDDLLSKFQRNSRVELPLQLDVQKLPQYQGQILQGMSGRTQKADHEIRDSLHGREMLEREFKKLKDKNQTMLLYIDNLENPDHLELLLPHAEHFPPGLRILVTTRNESVSKVIRSLGVDANRCYSMKVKTLGPCESKSLLRKEMLQSIDISASDDTLAAVNAELDDLEAEVLRLCNGLPLALKLMGRFIACYNNGGARNVKAWRHVIESMKKATSVDGGKVDKLYASLRVSIDEVEDTLKADLFDLLTSMDLLNIDGIDLSDKLRHRFYGFRGMPKNKGRVESVLGEQPMQNLIDRHLLEDDGEGVLGCHDVIRSLVNSIVSSHRDQLRITGDQLSELEDPELRNIVCLRCGTSSISVEDVPRLNRMKQLCYATIKLPSMAVEINLPNLKALVTYAGRHEHATVSLGKCPKLRLLIASNVQLDWQCATNPQYDNAQEIHPDSSHSLSSLCHLELIECDSLTIFPNGRSPPCFSRSLQTLQIIGCKNLRQISDTIRHFSQLTKLCIHHCGNLLLLPETMFEKMGGILSSLSLMGCENLKTLPEGISVLTSLTELDLQQCNSLTFLPEAMRNLGSLQNLQLKDCMNLKRLPDRMFEKLANTLLTLNLSGCKNLERLPEEMSMLTSLASLDLSGCTSITSIPEGVEHLVSLRDLRLRDCTNLAKLPDGMFDKMENCLSMLDLNGCENLKMLPDGISMLTSMTKLDLSRCKSITSLPKGMGNLIMLQDLQMGYCTRLQSLPDGMFDKLADNLLTLDFSGCENLKMLPDGISALTSLTELDLSSCKSLISLPEGMRNLVKIQRLQLSDCANLQRLPDGIFGNLANSVSTLDLSGCNELKMLPEGISALTSLIELDLTNCKSIAFLPDDMRDLVNLQRLKLNHCINLRRLPDGMFEKLGNSLSTLDMRACRKLEMLPEGISELTSLTELDLSHCQSITFLPEGMGNLIKLQDLRLNFCTNLQRIPDDMFDKLANNLATIQLDWCENLKKLPEGISMFTYLTRLDLAGCKSITFLPKDMGNLVNLQGLRLSSCTSLKRLPDGMFEKLTNSLSTLDLSRCDKLEMLPKGILGLTSLTELDLSGCKSLTFPPEGFGNLVNLEHLRLENCTNLQRLPEGMFDRSANNLSTLNLRGCENLEMLPEGISVLTSLRWLHLSGCKSITSLPEGISMLTSLTWLDLSSCKSITSLPEDMGNLVRLRELRMSYCTDLPDDMFDKLADSLSTLDLSWSENLKMIPEGISRLTSLTKLDLSRCESITSLPEGMGNLVRLQDLQLSFCTNLERLPASMFTERARNRWEVLRLGLVGCKKLGFLPEMTDEAVRNAAYNLGIDPNRCHFINEMAFRWRRSWMEEVFRSRSSRPSNFWIKDTDSHGEAAEIDAKQQAQVQSSFLVSTDRDELHEKAAVDSAASLMKYPKPVREEERRKMGMREVVLLY